MKWHLSRLGELASPEKGAIKIGPFGSQLKRDELVGEGVHVIGIENVLTRQFDGLGERFVTEDKYRTLQSVEVNPGDVLITMMGTIGEVAVVPPGIGTSIMDSHLLRFRPNLDLCVPEFIAWFLQSPGARAAVSGRAHGAIMKGLNSEIVRSLPVPVPPRSEQRRIVEILDQTDRLRGLRAEADVKAERILPVLLTKILGAPSTWASDRRARPLRDLANFVSGGTPSKRQSLYWTGEIPWVSPKDMKQDFICDAQDHISLNALEETYLTPVEEGSVLIVVRGMILARTVPISLTRCRVTINQDMKALLPKSTEVTGQYLWAALTLAKSRLLDKVSTAGHGTKKLDTPDLLQFRIPVPSPEQLAVVEAIVRTHEALREGRRRSRQRIDQVFGTLLSRAFTGDLTAKWRESHKSQLLRELEQKSTTLTEAT